MSAELAFEYFNGNKWRGGDLIAFVSGVGLRVPVPNNISRGSVPISGVVNNFLPKVPISIQLSSLINQPLSASTVANTGYHYVYDAAGNKVRLSVAIFLSAEKAHKKDFHDNP